MADLKSKDVPKKFNIETVTKFLRDSKINVLINGESIDESVIKPVVSGREMYSSHKVIDFKFNVIDGKFVLIAVMDSSMGTVRSYFLRFIIKPEWLLNIKIQK